MGTGVEYLAPPHPWPIKATIAWRRAGSSPGVVQGYTLVAWGLLQARKLRWEDSDQTGGAVYTPVCGDQAVIAIAIPDNGHHPFAATLTYRRRKFSLCSRVLCHLVSAPPRKPRSRRRGSRVLSLFRAPSRSPECAHISLLCASRLQLSDHEVRLAGSCPSNFA
jgi:hypothetical protein